VAADQSQRCYSGVGIFNWYYLSLPPQIPRFSRFVLELPGTFSHIWIQVAVSEAKLATLNFASYLPVKL
jgi:hypothetical protein